MSFSSRGENCILRAARAGGAISLMQQRLRFPFVVWPHGGQPPAQAWQAASPLGQRPRRNQRRRADSLGCARGSNLKALKRSEELLVHFLGGAAPEKPGRQPPAAASPALSHHYEARANDTTAIPMHRTPQRPPPGSYYNSRGRFFLTTARLHPSGVCTSSLNV